MDTPSEQYKTNASRSVRSSIVWQSVLGMIRRLIGFFMLAEEDQLKAGLYLGGEGRDG
jgi:hypothetical protein